LQLPGIWQKYLRKHNIRSYELPREAEDMTFNLPVKQVDPEVGISYTPQPTIPRAYETL
jgi:hypothetical protein